MSLSRTSNTSSIVGLPKLGLCGKQGAGISTAAELLAELGYSFEPLNEGDPMLMEICCERRWWQAKELGVVIVRITAPRQLQVDRMRGFPGADLDLDDTEQLAADYVIENDGTKAELLDELMNVIVKERNKR